MRTSRRVFPATQSVAIVVVVLAAALTACTETTGVVQGQLIAGGAPPSSNNPLAGTVVAHSDDASGPVVATATVGADGRYNFVLAAPGMYVVTGSPRNLAGATCENAQVQVSRGDTTVADILCQP